MLADHPDRSPRHPICATMPAVDYEAAGLLDGLEGDDLAARVRLLDRLVEEGFSEPELQAAIREDRLALLLVERVLGGRYTAEQLEQRTGLDAAQMPRIRRLLGLPEASPDDLVFGEEEIDAAQSTRLVLDVGVAQQARAEMPRVLGAGRSPLAPTPAPA